MRIFPALCCLVAHPVGLGATFLFICGECWNGLAKNDMSTFHNH